MMNYDGERNVEPERNANPIIRQGINDQHSDGVYVFFKWFLYVVALISLIFAIAAIFIVFSALTEENSSDDPTVNFTCDAYTEHYTKCGSACLVTCPKYELNACKDFCVEGCFCNQGLVRNLKTEKCIAENDCKSEMFCDDPNESYIGCEPECPDTCPPRKSNNCTHNCVRDCFCNSGYVRDVKSRKCIPKDQCNIS